MVPMIRREAVSLLAGTSVGAILGLTGNGASVSDPQLRNQHVNAALVQGTLTLAQVQGRRLVGFVETGVPEGQVFCSLVRQHAKNPAVQSVFAAPVRRDGKAGVEVAVSFFTEPVGDVTFSLLHIHAPADVPVAGVAPTGAPGGPRSQRRSV